MKVSSGQASHAAIHLRNFDFAYREKKILSIPELKISVGAHTLIYGESGCGKSTLMGLISGILTGHTGDLEVLGSDYSGMRAAEHDRFRAKNIAVIFQQFNLIPYLSVRENILLGARLAGKKVDVPRMENILEHLQIASLAAQPAVSLSHGQGQRVAAARALVGQCPVILADEPTSALDDNNARLFLDLLFREAAENKTTIVVVSHDLRHKHRFDKVIDLAKLNRAPQVGMRTRPTRKGRAA